MGYDLAGAGGVFSMNIAGWTTALREAWEAGWCPAGTEPPDHEMLSIAPEEWEGGDYFTNSGQIVTEDDARALALALRRASSNADGAWQERLLELASFCAAGHFAIW
jgi:hypothetical protein